MQLAGPSPSASLGRHGCARGPMGAHSARCTTANRRGSLKIVAMAKKGFGSVPVGQQKQPAAATPPPSLEARQSAQQPVTPPTPPPPQLPPQQLAAQEVVSDRMLGRILIFSGIPLLFGFASGPFFYYMNIVQKAELPPVLMYTSGTAIFAAAAVGITWGVVSSSWDPSRPGSFWGNDEVSRNMPVLLDKFLPKAMRKREYDD